MSAALQATTSATHAEVGDTIRIIRYNPKGDGREMSARVAGCGPVGFAVRPISTSGVVSETTLFARKGW